MSAASLIANLPPVSDPKGPYAGIAGQSISFDGSASSDTDGNLVTFDWDFGDGNGATGVSPTHAYQAAGSYTVTLTVTDDGGLTHTASVEAVVNDALCVACGICAGACPTSTPFRRRAALTPGIDFGENQASTHVRFAYTRPVDQLERACCRIARYIK